jgi:glycosyltransferase involved in cell wall biosynthesis
MNSPLVSIASITYNQENFILPAIESWLMQITDFDFEVIIGDDCSSDSTLDIIEKYAKKCPERIKLFKSERNLGMMPNFLRTLKNCRGKYIAICEGDDYWTDPLKLQKQIDYLEKNPQCVICFHNATILNMRDGSWKPFHNKLKVKEYAGEDLLRQWLIPTASIVFRNVLQEQLPDFFLKATHGDLALFLYLSQFGNIASIPGNMSVYRLNNTGITNLFAGINHNLAHIEQCKLMLIYFYPRYKHLLQTRIASYYLSVARFEAQLGNRKSAIKSLIESIKFNPFIFAIKLKEFAKFAFDFLIKR